MGRRPSNEYALDRMDFLIVQLVHLRDYKFVEDVLDLHDVMSYRVLPDSVSDTVADILEERLNDLRPEEFDA